MGSEYKARLFEMIISGKGLQYIMDACADMLGNPFVFANRSLQLVGKSSSCNLYPEVFDWFEDYSGEHLQIAQEASKAGYFNAIYSNDAPVYGRISGITTNWVAARVRLKRQILGNILVADCQKPFTEEYEELMPLVCQTIAFSLQQPVQNNNGDRNYEAMLIDLLNGNMLNSTLDDMAVREHFKLLGWIFPQKIRVLIVRPANSSHTVNPTIIDAQLRSQFPLSLGIIYKNDCIRVLDSKLSEEIIEERLLQYIHTEDMVCGISRSFSSALSLKDAYLQADAAIRLRRKQKNIRLHTFDDVSGLYLLEQVTDADKISKEGMIIPEIRMLQEAGDGMCQERMQDLAAYMSCGRNVTRAAELRGVHKNSMYYRLDKIAELTGLDLKDDNNCIQVILSLSMLGYLPFCSQYN